MEMKIKNSVIAAVPWARIFSCVDVKQNKDEIIRLRIRNGPENFQAILRLTDEGRDDAEGLPWRITWAKEIVKDNNTMCG
jgi:hypothetical protein